jgi:hypothetical protein
MVDGHSPECIEYSPFGPYPMHQGHSAMRGATTGLRAVGSVPSSMRGGAGPARVAVPVDRVGAARVSRGRMGFSPARASGPAPARVGTHLEWDAGMHSRQTAAMLACWHAGMGYALPRVDGACPAIHTRQGVCMPSQHGVCLVHTAHEACQARTGGGREEGQGGPAAGLMRRQQEALPQEACQAGRLARQQGC